MPSPRANAMRSGASRFGKCGCGLPRPRGAWLLAWLWPAAAAAQVPLGALPLGPPGRPAGPDTLLLLGARARRVGTSTYVGQSTLSGRLALDPAGRQQLRYRLLSDLIYDTRGEPPFVREDYRADLAHAAAVGRAGGPWRVGAQLHYDQSRANATRTGVGLARLGYERPLRWPGQGRDSLSGLRLTVLGGLASDQRNGRRDAGLAYGFDALAVLYPNGLVAPLVLRALATRARLGPRTVQRLVAETAGEYSFLANTPVTVAVRAGYRSQRAEDYVLNSVQRIQSDTLAAQLGGTYRLGPNATLRSDNGVLWPTRAFRYRRLESSTDTLQDLGYRQRELDTRQELRFARPKLQTVLTFSFRERRRAYYLDNSRNLSPARLAAALSREQVRDVTEQTTRWQGELTWLPRPRHALGVLATAQLLRVDAPSKDNQQVRDEAQHLLRLSWTGRWAGAFRTSLAAAGEYRQFVFIRAQQSAENYADYLLHWEPGFTWAPGRLSLRSQLHLWVSYQVRDRASEQVRNRASRVLEQTQSASYQITPKLAAQAEFSRRENRIGQLDWTRFRESPLDTAITQELSASLRRQWAGQRVNASLRLGYRLLEQRTYGRAGLSPEAANGGLPTLIFLHRITRQQGPEAAVECRGPGGLVLAASLWLQWLRTFNDYRQGTGTYVAGPSYTAADLTQELRRVLPYFEVTAEWRVGRRRL